MKTPWELPFIQYCHPKAFSSCCHPEAIWSCWVPSDVKDNMSGDLTHWDSLNEHGQTTRLCLIRHCCRTSCNHLNSFVLMITFETANLFSVWYFEFSISYCGSACVCSCCNIVARLKLTLPCRIRGCIVQQVRQKYLMTKAGWRPTDFHAVAHAHVSWLASDLVHSVDLLPKSM